MVTMSKPSSPSTESTRYQRLRPVIEYLHGEPALDLDAVKQHFHEEQPAFLTRIVNELASQGWLVRESPNVPFVWNETKGSFSIAKWLDRKLYGAQIKASPEQDRPRERLLAVGADQLRTAELVAILVRSGLPGESAVMAGQKVAQHFDQRLDKLPEAGRAELKAVSRAIVTTAYCQIMAGIELGRRVEAADHKPASFKITGSDDAIRFCQQHFLRLSRDQTHEEFHIVTLDTKNKFIQSHQVTVGTLDASLVHPREVFRFAIRDSASSIILVHNHPSGDPTPSREDIQVTDRLTESGELLGIDVLDHIVLGRDAAISIRASR